MFTITPKMAFFVSIAGLAIGTVSMITRDFVKLGLHNDVWLFVAVDLMFLLPIAVIAVAPSWYLFRHIVRARTGLAKWALAIAAMLLPTTGLASMFFAGKITEITVVVACVFLPTIVAAVLLALAGSSKPRPLTDRFQIHA